MDSQILTRNAIVSVVQVLITSIALLVLYRFLIKTIGIDHLGIWSIVMASATALKVGEMGLSGSATKYVAKYQELNEPEQVSIVVQTTVLTLMVIVPIILTILYPLLVWLLGYILPESANDEAVGLIPLALVYFWMLSLSSVFQAGLDGCLRTDLRGIVVIGGTLLLLVLAYVLVPRFGLTGLVYAQLAQVLATTISGWILLRMMIRELPVIPYQWRYNRFREMFGYGVNLQFINVCIMLTEPVTKMYLGKFGGVSAAGYYEMAQRLISQGRAVLLAANQVLVPVIARLHETDAYKIRNIYRANYEIILYLTLPAYLGIIALSPIISELWIGEHVDIFVLFIVMLSSAAILHGLSGSAYFMNLGTGNLRSNVVAHSVMAICNLGFGYFFGIRYGALGVVAGASLALVIGGLIVTVSYHIRHQVAWSELVPPRSITLAVTCTAGVAVCLMAYYGGFTRVEDGWKVLVICILMMIFFLPAMWFHPQRRLLQTMLKNGIQ